MINFYTFYNKSGLDKEEYKPLICDLLEYYFSKDLRSIEHIIKKDSQLAFAYAHHIIHGRWIEAEPYIMKDDHWWSIYKLIFGC